MGIPGGWELIIVVGVVVLLFGGKKIPELAKGLGKGIKDFKQAVKEGLVDIFVDAKCAVSTPTCGPCLGGHMGVLAEGEIAISTTNRNFVGRMGHTKSKVYLASPVVAATSGIKGYIASPKSLQEES